jgi:2-polyprenyl-6-methoxyphenol hydroxylase-like FAD-dependent oxidoreductase
MMLGSRHNIMELLFNALKDKSKLQGDRMVRDVREDESGIEVILQDGSVERGDILVGADGAHSTIRNKIRQTAPDKGAPPPVICEYNCLFGKAPGLFTIKRGDLDHVQGYGATLTVYADDKFTYFAIVAKKERPTLATERTRYTEQDQTNLAAKFEHHPINNSYTFGNLWAGRQDSGLTDLQEGVWGNWHSGRIVLAGDAVHKVSVLRKALDQHLTRALRTGHPRAWSGCQHGDAKCRLSDQPSCQRNARKEDDDGRADIKCLQHVPVQKNRRHQGHNQVLWNLHSRSCP